MAIIFLILMFFLADSAIRFVESDLKDDDLIMGALIGTVYGVCFSVFMEVLYGR